MNYKVTYKTLDSALNAQKMFNLRQQATESILDGKFRKARTLQKEFAKTAVNDFDTYKTLPNINYVDMPTKMWFALAWKSIKFKIFKAFTKKSTEEKELSKKFSEYKKGLSKANSAKKTINISLKSLYY